MKPSVTTEWCAVFWYVVSGETLAEVWPDKVRQQLSTIAIDSYLRQVYRKIDPEGEAK